MKFEIKECQDVAVTVKDMPIGAIGRFADGSWGGHVLLRTYNNLVSLTDPSKTWGVTTDYLIALIPEATVTLTFGKD